MKKKMHLLIVVILALTLVWQPAAGLGNTSPERSSVFLALALVGQPDISQVRTIPPLSGIWEAIDVDGSLIRLVLGGPVNGVYQVTWTESYISYCDGGPGIARGSIAADPTDPAVLVGQLVLTCQVSGRTLELPVLFVYDPETATLSTDDATFKRPNSKACIAHPGGLTNWWPADGSAADIASGKDAVLGGDATFSSGLVNRSFLLDGDGDYVEIPYHPALTAGRQDFSVNLWVNFKSLAGEQVLAEQWDQSGGPRGWTLTKLENNVIRLALGDGSGSEVDIDSAPLSLRARAWYNFAAVRSGDTLRLYLNSQTIAQANGIEPINLSNPASFKLGHRGTLEQPDNRYHFLNGRIDEAQLFLGTALSHDQIKDIFKAGALGQCKDNVQPAPPSLNPMIWADPLAEYINGWGWPEGNLILIEVYDGDEQIYANQQETRPDTGVGFALRDVGQDLHAGHLVVLRDGSFEKTLVLTNLDLTAIDLASLTASGTSDPTLELYVSFDEQEAALTAQDESGNWSAPFAAHHTNMAAFQPDADGDMTGFGTGLPNPYMVIFPHFDFMDGFNWPPGSTVDISVSEKPECSLSRLVDTPDAYPWNTFFNGNFPEGCDVEIGDTVTMQVGEIVRSHTVYNLHLTAWDEDARILSGSADPGAEVYVWGPDMPAVLADIDEGGSWSADLSGYYTPQPGHTIRAQITDLDGSATAADWYIWSQPEPAFIIFPEWEWMDGFNWELDVPVSVSVAGKPWCDISHTPWGDPWATFFNGPFGEGCDVTYGDQVTLTQGEIVKIHVVEYLVVDAIDTAADAISGWAAPGAEVFAWRHESDSSQATADGDGYWTVSLPEGVDLQPGDCGRAEIRDEDGDATDVEWCIPSPVITAQITDGWFEGRGFTPGSQVSYTLYDPTTGYELSGALVADEHGNASVNNLELAPGQIITMDDGVTLKTLVIEHLAYFFINTDTGYASGWASGDPNRRVWVGYGGDDFGDSLDLYTDENGMWRGVFSAPLPEGIWWHAVLIFDGDGDSSEVRPDHVYPGGYTPNQTITAHLEHSWFEGRGYIPGSAISFSVADGSTGEILHDGVVWADRYGNAHVYTLDLEPGMIITMDDGLLLRTLELEELTFTSINLETGEVSGWAAAPPGRAVWIGIGWDDFGMSIDANTTEDGSWFGSFGGPLPPDIRWIASQIYDEDGDATEVQPAQILP